MLKLALVMSKEEGFGLAGKIPTIRNNPGDLRHSPHSSHEGIDPNAIGKIDTLQHGWDDFDRQIKLDAGRGLTLRGFIMKFAPPSENNSEGYLNYVCKGMGCTPETPLNHLLSEAESG